MNKNKSHHKHESEKLLLSFIRDCEDLIDIAIAYDYMKYHCVIFGSEFRDDFIREIKDRKKEIIDS